MFRLILFLSMGASLTFSQDQTAPRVGLGKKQAKLSLERAVEMALENNLDIEIEKSNVDNALQALKGSRGIYDLRVRSHTTLDSGHVPAASVFSSNLGRISERAVGARIDIEKNLPFAGASFEIGFETSRQSSTDPLLALNPYTTARLGLSFAQQLSRGRSIDEGRAQILIRQKQVDLAQAEFELKVCETITRVEIAYWDLVAARQNIEVKSDAVGLARTQLDRTRRMVQEGSLPAAEIPAAEAELERRRDSYFQAVGDVTEAENRLKLLLAKSRAAALWNDEIIPSDDNPILPPPPEDLTGATQTALEGRQELRVLANQKGAIQVEKRLKADLTKPLVTLRAGFTSMGIAGTSAGSNSIGEAGRELYARVNFLSDRYGLPPLRPPDLGSLPNKLIGGYGTSWSNLFAGRYHTLQVGLVIDLTAGNAQARAELARSTISERRLDLQRARMEQTIEAEVRNSLQSLQISRQRIVASEASVKAAEEKLASEDRLFQSGESTNFLLLTRQNEYVDSRYRLLAAILDLRKSAALLRKAIGTTAHDHGTIIK